MVFYRLQWTYPGVELLGREFSLKALQTRFPHGHLLNLTPDKRSWQDNKEAASLYLI